MKKIEYKDVDEVLYYEKLPNGLEVYMYPKDTAKNFYITFNTHFGSMDTEFKISGNKKGIKVPNGTAHFLEHQMFQMEDHAAFDDFARLGSSVNAFTTYNFTCYEVIASDKFKENLELLLDVVQTPVFKKSSINTERGIIKEEIKMYDNNPMACLTYGLEYNLNNNDKHKYLISGTVDDIKEINADTLMSCYEAFYHPSNMFLVITGKFKPLEALGIIKENQNIKEFSDAKRITRISDKEPLSVCKNYEEKKMDVSIPKVKIAYKMNRKLFKDYSDLELKIYLDAILNIKFGSTSDLLEHMVNSNLINWDIEVMREVRSDYVVIMFTLESEYKDEAIGLIKDELLNMTITKDEITRIKRSNIANFILHFNDIVSVCEDIQDDIINNRGVVSDIMDYYKSINVSDANKIASSIDLSNECIYVISKITD